MDRTVILLGLLLTAHFVQFSRCLPQPCLLVPTAAADTSTARLLIVKNNTSLDVLCPGTTYGIALVFPESRQYQLVSTKGALKDAQADCINRVTRTAASTAGQEQLYLGCAAAGSVTLHMISTVGGAQMVKSVTKSVRSLAECPKSSCNNQGTVHAAADSASTTSASSAAAPAGSAGSSGNTVVTLTGNPVADIQMLYGLFTSTMSPFRLPTALDAAIAFQLVSIVRSLQDSPMDHASTLSVIKKLLDLVPADSDPLGLVAGMKTFLSFMEPYVSATLKAGSTAASLTSALGPAGSMATPGGALNLLSSFASLAGGAPHGAASTSGTAAGANPADLLSMMSSLSALMNAGAPGAPGPAN